MNLQDQQTQGQPPANTRPPAGYRKRDESSPYL